MAAASAAPALFAQKKPMLLFIGVYTNNSNKGISSAHFDPATGAITDLAIAAETPNPTFLELHPSGKFLYAINEIGNYEGQRAGSICAFSIDRDSGKLTQLNRVTAKGSGPCHVNLDHSGRMAMLANYGSGSVASYRILPDGKLSDPVSFFQHQGNGPNKGRQEGPHAHSINPTPDNKYAVACDLGTDEIFIYAIKPEAGSMSEHKSVRLAPGSGPRHFAWHPNKRYGYCVNELNSTVTALNYLPEGDLDEIHTVSTLPEGFKGQNFPAEIRVHPSGKWLYASNRGEDSIAAFNIDSKTGKIAPMGNTPTKGVMPRNFFIEPSGRWLLAANQRSNNIVIFAIDAKTGKLQPADKGLTVGQPVCLRTLS